MRKSSAKYRSFVPYHKHFFTMVAPDSEMVVVDVFDHTEFVTSWT